MEAMRSRDDEIMTVRTVTVQLPETLYRQAKETAAAKSLSVEEVLAQSIALSLPPLAEELPPYLRLQLLSLMLLSDDELWSIARAEMEAGQQDRLETLTDSREARELTAEEALELEAIVVEGESLMVKKAEAYRLLTRRGFTIPWINQ